MSKQKQIIGKKRHENAIPYQREKKQDFKKLIAQEYV